VTARKARPYSAKTTDTDAEQYQRFLDKARELGLEPTAETDLAHLRDVTRRLAKLPTQRVEPMKGKPRGASKRPSSAE
jgi:hypothetical protein